MFRRKIISVVLVLILVMAIVPITPARAQINIVHANTAEELKNAIASNTEIILSGTTYSVGVWLSIRDVENLTITGTSGTRIVNNSQEDMTISIYNSRNVSVRNVYMGHDIPPTYRCEVGVVGVSDGVGRGVGFGCSGWCCWCWWWCWC